MDSEPIKYLQQFSLDIQRIFNLVELQKFSEID